MTAAARSASLEGHVIVALAALSPGSTIDFFDPLWKRPLRLNCG